MTDEGEQTAEGRRSIRERLKRIGRIALRSALLTLTVLVVLVATALVSLVTIDLGPSVKRLAEEQGSKLIERPIHIGRLSFRLVTGKFVIENLTIEGLAPTDRPFLTTKRIDISLAWLPLLQREVMIESVEMSDWQMLVETFEHGHNFPKFTSDEPRRKGPISTTLREVRAGRGHFTFEDHGAPWSVVAPNINLQFHKVGFGANYRGTATFSQGTVTIQDYVPMRADFRTWFRLDDGMVRLDRIDLVTDGAKSVVDGWVDFTRWPEQQYRVRSRIDFPRMRELFFARETFRLSGEGTFNGTFHLYKGGRELKGSFDSPLAGFNDYRFPMLRGSLVWNPERFEVIEATSQFQGGTTEFRYLIAPLGVPQPAIAKFDATYDGVDLATFSDFMQMKGMRLNGRASGQNALEWPLGKFSERHMKGRMVVAAPQGVRVLTRELPATLRSSVPHPAGEAFPPLGYVPIAGDVNYELGPEWIDLGPSYVATPTSYVEFSGRTAYGERTMIPFHVTSADWQESDRLMAGVMTAFGHPTRAVPVNGAGSFDGVFLRSFGDPRIEGTFTGRNMRGWDTVWGDGRAKIVVENHYLDVSDAVMALGTAQMAIDGRFSLGYPRRDGGEELNARIRVTSFPVTTLKHAFSLDDYQIDGLMTGEYHLYGRYQRPFGFGKTMLADLTAYREPFDSATASLRFENTGIFFEAIEIGKGGGAIRGAALLGWDGTYTFNADARRISIESFSRLRFPRAPLTGLVEFSANGSGRFESPRYEVRARVNDLFVGDEGVGQLTGRISVRDQQLNLELEASSPRLAVSGAGHVALTESADGEISLRFTGTSLDPYVRILEPRLPGFTTAVASGTLKAAGQFSDIDRLVVDATIEQLDLRLFDYQLRTAADDPATPAREDLIELALDRHTVLLRQCRLAGVDTELDLGGSVALHDQRVALDATGKANLGILQGFFARQIRSSGAVDLAASLQGPLSQPVLSGRATIVNGRLRYLTLPHSVEAINGQVSFGGGNVRLEDVAARIGTGPVQFGGRVVLDGFFPRQFDLTMTGQDMLIRYPEDFRSRVDADLALRGDIKAPVLSGTITVEQGTYDRRFDPIPEFRPFAPGRTPEPAVPVRAAGDSLPLQLDIRITAPSTLRVDNNLAQVGASADLNLRGTYDRPLLFGRAEVERGYLFFEGRRYQVTLGTIDFTDPTRIDPFFDFEGETRVRTPGQTYRVGLRVSGTRQRMNWEFSSDPPLPEVDVLSLLLGDARSVENPELRALQSQEAYRLALVEERMARYLASSLSAEVGRAVEKTFGLDTFQVTPSLTDPSQSSRVNPGARLTLGKQISERVYITFSRSLTSAVRDQIILLEYDATDRVSWILTQNEDRTYSLDFRVRRTF
jgi:hypothetical protein